MNPKTNKKKRKTKKTNRLTVLTYLPTLPFHSIAKTYIQETRSLVHGPARLGLPDFGYSCSVSVLEVRHSWTIMDYLGIISKTASTINNTQLWSVHFKCWNCSSVLDYLCIPILILTAVNNHHHHLDLCSTDNVTMYIFFLSPSSRTNVTNFVSLSLVIL